jgi:hypothetical protein
MGERASCKNSSAIVSLPSSKIPETVRRFRFLDVDDVTGMVEDGRGENMGAGWWMWV